MKQVECLMSLIHKRDLQGVLTLWATFKFQDVIELMETAVPKTLAHLESIAVQIHDLQW